ncbi:helix-turn-helix domain-containing protein [Sinorhizobium mexicanum]|uniref:Helix-turn-helix domain-containing protein n=1 Tax=Sinorhizobium mexicanum TaxID=375549 RepID=A0A859QWH5_9HYPH|nr:helix-turn-helix domain-containing protein [Sinorhizobium mexicanum]MBP1881944.1 transcriptional regulator with XRE-family HTH domain [Sinorhizobium mexicanum]QLL61678.1 helix-turn-helix domain-containing protein [Sinorhizobium mexicanum]
MASERMPNGAEAGKLAELIATGRQRKEIAEMIGVSRSQLRNIMLGRKVLDQTRAKLDRLFRCYCGKHS